jgi:hypothetical protein
LVAEQLNVLASPHQAAGYTSGRSSNEAAFLCQLFVRNGGTNDPGVFQHGPRGQRHHPQAGDRDRQGQRQPWATGCGWLGSAAPGLQPNSGADRESDPQVSGPRHRDCQPGWFRAGPLALDERHLSARNSQPHFRVSRILRLDAGVPPVATDHPVPRPVEDLPLLLPRPLPVTVPSPRFGSGWKAWPKPATAPPPSRWW